MADEKMEPRFSIRYVNPAVVMNLRANYYIDPDRDAYTLDSNQEYVEAMPEVDLVVGSQNRAALPLEVLDALGIRCPDEATQPGSPLLTKFAEHTRAFIKIEDGCNQMCSYCKIPFYRGRARSRTSEEVLREIQMLVQQGYREMVLCGIQLGAFGRDTGESLSELLHRIDCLEGLGRFRLSSIEPDDVSDELADTLLDLNRLAPHLHLPLQSGDDGILKRMRRRYSIEDYRRLVIRLRRRNPHFAFSTDLMVGFPGETDEAFENSIRAVQEFEFCRVHIFRFSARTGTAAARLPNKVPQGMINRRREIIGHLAEEVVNRVRQAQINRHLIVLLEEPGSTHDTAVGFSENYLRVQASGVSHNQLGQLVPVVIESMDQENLLGKATG